MTTARYPTFRRHDTMVYADRLRFERQQWLSPRFVAKQLQTALANPGLAGDPGRVISRAEMPTEFARLHPKAVQRIGGEAVVRAAVPERSACRWCQAVLYAMVHRKQIPSPYNAGARLLLGEPCEHPRRMTKAERRAAMAKLNRRFESSRLEALRRQQAKIVEKQRNLVASGAKPGFIVGDPASWRKWAREDLANRAPWVLGRKGRYATHSYQCLCAGCRRAW